MVAGWGRPACEFPAGEEQVRFTSIASLVMVVVVVGRGSRRLWLSFVSGSWLFKVVVPFVVVSGGLCMDMGVAFCVSWLFPVAVPFVVSSDGACVGMVVAFCVGWLVLVVVTFVVSSDGMCMDMDVAFCILWSCRCCCV